MVVKLYHATNSSHVIDHFLSTLHFLGYMCCVVFCWKSRLMLAVCVLEGTVASCRRLVVYLSLSNDPS